jgi:hypothetical protein
MLTLSVQICTKLSANMADLAIFHPSLRPFVTLRNRDMTRLIRKQTHSDFRSRVKRVDPAFYRWGERANLRDATVKRPFGSVLGGFLCAYVVIAVANNRSYLESSLR